MASIELSRTHLRHVARPSQPRERKHRFRSSRRTRENVMTEHPDLILYRGLFTTLDPSNPTASAVAIKDGIFTAVGHDHEIMKLAESSTKVIDLKGKRVLP